MPLNNAYIDWAKIKNKPNTLSGFGITDALANGQTWQNLTASRATNTTYTNTTSKPIFISVNYSGVGQLQWLVDGAGIGTNGDSGGYNTMISIIVPAGSTYRCVVGSGSPTLQSWNELR